MKIIIISDIHGSDNWKRVIPYKDQFDKIVVLGDEFDSWTNKWPNQMDNALDLIKFKTLNSEKVDLCWSNHATSYFLREQCSGFQPERFIDIKEFYDKNQNLYDAIYIYDNWVFSHAGISKAWMKSCGIKNIRKINRLFRERPNYFRWVGPNGYGDNDNEGPFWIRPISLLKNSIKKYHQCVGHTEGNDPRMLIQDKQIFVFADTKNHDYFVIIDTNTNNVEFVNL